MSTPEAHKGAIEFLKSEYGLPERNGWSLYLEAL